MITLRPGGVVILIGLLVPMTMLLVVLALDAFEDYLFPPRQPPPLENTNPQQSETD